MKVSVSFVTTDLQTEAISSNTLRMFIKGWNMNARTVNLKVETKVIWKDILKRITTDPVSPITNCYRLIVSYTDLVHSFIIS